MRKGILAVVAMSALTGMMGTSPVRAASPTIGGDAGGFLEPRLARYCSDEVRGKLADPDEFEIVEPFIEVKGNVFMAVVILPNEYGALQKVKLGCTFNDDGTVRAWTQEYAPHHNYRDNTVTY